MTAEQRQEALWLKVPVASLQSPLSLLQKLSQVNICVL